MNTISLRFSDSFSSVMGTIKEHSMMIEKNGFVWYGKLGNRVSEKVRETILKNDDPAILLIHSGTNKRYWAFVADIIYETPEQNKIPEYYRNNANNFSTWFKLTKIINAPDDIMSKCYVTSSHKLLTHASQHSMSPYFIITTEVEPKL